MTYEVQFHIGDVSQTVSGPDAAHVAGLCASLKDQGPKANAAIGTLESMGYLWEGGILWRPPVAEAPAQPLPEIEKPEDPHAELRKTWAPGQRWEYRDAGSNDSWSERLGEPLWSPVAEYRRHPEDVGPYASAEESKAAISTDTRTPAEKKLDALVDAEIERKGYDLPSINDMEVLRSVALSLIEESDTVPAVEKPWYPDDSGEWVEVGVLDGKLPAGMDRNLRCQTLGHNERSAKRWIGTSTCDAIDWDWHVIAAYKVASP